MKLNNYLKDALDLAGLKENLDYIHEFKVKVRDVHNRIRLSLDFYFPSLKKYVLKLTHYSIDIHMK